MSYVDHVAAIKAALAELTRLAAQAKALAKDREAGRQLGAAERFELKAHVLEGAVKTVRRHLAQVHPSAPVDDALKSLAEAPSGDLGGGGKGRVAGDCRETAKNADFAGQPVILKTADRLVHRPPGSPGRRREEC